MQDILVVLMLVVLEGLLSFDNALALAAMVRHLPDYQRKKALTWGIAGAFAFRFIALASLTRIIALPGLKMIGAAYLIWLAIAHFMSAAGDKNLPESNQHFFWRTIILVELTDMAFSIDSILASVAMST